MAARKYPAPGTLVRKLKDGQFFLFLDHSIKRPKGEASYVEYHVRPFDPDNGQDGSSGYTWKSRSTDFVALLDITPERTGELDERLAAHKKARDEAKAAFIASKKAEAEAEAVQQLIDDATWNDAVVTQGRRSVDADEVFSGYEDLIIVGPTRSSTRRSGEEYEWFEDINVTIYYRTKSSCCGEEDAKREPYAEINWPSVGSSSPAKTRAFARLLAVATDRAEEMVARGELPKTDPAPEGSAVAVG